MNIDQTIQLILLKLRCKAEVNHQVSLKLYICTCALVFAQSIVRCTSVYEHK